MIFKASVVPESNPSTTINSLIQTSDQAPVPSDISTIDISTAIITPTPTTIQNAITMTIQNESPTISYQSNDVSIVSEVQPTTRLKTLPMTTEPSAHQSVHQNLGTKYSRSIQQPEATSQVNHISLETVSILDMNSTSSILMTTATSAIELNTGNAIRPNKGNVRSGSVMIEKSPFFALALLGLVALLLDC